MCNSRDRKDERRVYLEYLINVYAKKHMSDTKQEKYDVGRKVFEKKLNIYVGIGKYTEEFLEKDGIICVETQEAFWKIVE